MPTIELKLTQMAYGGAAIGRHEGKVFFVPYGIPGETVAVEVETEKKSLAWARLDEVLVASPDRVEPPCPHFGPTRCGGCQWQHIRGEAQLAFKTEIVREQLARLGGIRDAEVKPARAAGDFWGYRNHVQLHPSPTGLGYVATDGRRIEPITVCPIMHPLVAGLFRDCAPSWEGTLERLLLRAGVNTGEKMAIAQMIDGRSIATTGRDHFFEEVSGLRFRISAGSFFQVNTAGAGAMVEIVRQYLAPRPAGRVLDLYCGVGLFTLAVAGQVREVTAVEAERCAAADAGFNVEAAGLDNVTVIEGDAAGALAAVRPSVGAVIVDPPRTGCGWAVLRKLAALRPARLVYVSCDPATFARDAKALVASGYRLAEVQPIDLFPQTFHIETVSLFSSGADPRGA
jgi:23S rRNA (uracil1939-C5)-methyltransferase